MTKYFRAVSKLCLFLSAFSLLFIEYDKICFGSAEYIGYLSDMNGVGSDDDVVFKLLAIVTFVLSLFLSLIKNKIGYAFLIFVYVVCQYLVFLFVESSTAWNMVWASIIYCDNSYLLIWVILQILFIISSLLYLCFASDDFRKL